MAWAGRFWLPEVGLLLHCHFTLRRWVLFVVVGLIAVGFCSALHAQQSVTFTPADTSIEFTLGATLHTVHGTFKLKHGEIQFDPATGAASGAIVIDATSGETGNSSRDHNMHASVLNSGTYPEIIFSPSRIAPVDGAGSLRFPLPQGTTILNVSGVIHLRGQDHDLMMPVTVERNAGGTLRVSSRFSVPYVKWGLKNPSTFVLRVSDTVNVEVQSSVHISP